MNKIIDDLISYISCILFLGIIIYILYSVITLVPFHLYLTYFIVGYIIFISLLIVDRMGNIRENDIVLFCNGYLKELDIGV
jgi:hypothetical protein